MADPGFRVNSNPGIRRPRWGGVVEGVAGQIRHPLTYEGGSKTLVRQHAEGAANRGLSRN